MKFKAFLLLSVLSLKTFAQIPLFLEKFVTIERNIAKEKGTTKLFALLQLEEAGASWDVVISSEGLPDDGENLENLRFVVDKINEVLDVQETIRVPRVILRSPD